MRSSMTTSYFNVETGSKARTILGFDNGAPALVEKVNRTQKTMLLTTTIDVDLSDLVIRSSFPAIIQNVVRYLGSDLRQNRQTSFKQKQSVELTIPTGLKSVLVQGPDGGYYEPDKSEAKEHRAIFRQLEKVGIYRVFPEKGQSKDLPQLSFVVNPSLNESNFTPIAPSTIVSTLTGNQEGATSRILFGTRTNDDMFETRGWASLLLGALGVFVALESLLAARG